METWFKTYEQKPPPNEHSNDYCGVSIDVLVWREGMDRACISAFSYDEYNWLDDEAMTPLPRHCYFTHWTYLPEIPTDKIP